MKIEKDLANTVSPETARISKKLEIQTHSEDANYVDNAINRIGPTITKICEDRSWTQAALLHHLDEKYFPHASTLSRIVNHNEKRHVSAAQLFELRRVMGISLDKLADDCDPFEFQEMSTTRLLAIMQQICVELAGRNLQKSLPNSEGARVKKAR